MSDAADIQLTHSVLGQFGRPLVSYISGIEVDAEWPTHPLPANVGLTIAKLNEIRVAVATSGQPLSFTVSRLALQGYFDALREELGGQLSELVSSDPVVQSLSVILRGLSTLMLTAPHLYAFEPFPNAAHEVGIWSPDLESSFRRSVARDPALQNLLLVDYATETSEPDATEFAADFRANGFLNSLLRSCYVTGRFRRKTGLQELGEIAHELLQGARAASADGVATVSYFSVINGIGLTDMLQWESVCLYPLNDVCHDILDREVRPSIGADQVMGFVLELRHRRRYIQTVDPATGAYGYNASPEAPVELEKQLQAVPLAIALATQLAGRAVWTSVADARMGILPVSFKADSNAVRGGVVETSSQSEITDWLSLLNGLDRTKLRIAERRLMSALSERPQPADRLIDAVVVWEALFGNNQELSFRISMGMAFLIGETRSEIGDVRKQCVDIYNLRSKLVHGSVDVNDRRIVEAADQASDLSLRAMKMIYRDAPELINAKSAERTMKAVLRRAPILPSAVKLIEAKH